MNLKEYTGDTIKLDETVIVGDRMPGPSIGASGVVNLSDARYTSPSGSYMSVGSYTMNPNKLQADPGRYVQYRAAPALDARIIKYQKILTAVLGINFLALYIALFTTTAEELLVYRDTETNIVYARPVVEFDAVEAI